MAGQCPFNIDIYQIKIDCLGIEIVVKRERTEFKWASVFIDFLQWTTNWRRSIV